MLVCDIFNQFIYLLYLLLFYNLNLHSSFLTLFDQSVEEHRVVAILNFEFTIYDITFIISDLV